LTLALEGPAAEVLKDFDDTTETAYEDPWKRIEHRFGEVDESREAQRKFGNRRQTESESLQEYEQALRTLYKQGWPSATTEIRDAALKRRFEDGLASPELSQYLRLHHRKSNFGETVEQARLYIATVEGAKTKKAVRFLAEAEEDEEGQSAILNHLRVLEKKLDQMERDRSRPKSPEKTPRGPRQASRSPSPLTGNRQSGNTPPARRFGQNPGRTWMAPSPPPTRSFFNRNQTPPRGRGQGCWTCGKLGCHSLLHERNDVPPARQVRPVVPPLMGTSPRPVSPPNPASPRPRRRSGCHVCGRFGCHTVFHDDGFSSDREDRGFPPLPVSPVPAECRGQQQGNDSRNPSSGTRAPQNQ